jgi:hypothetical protein
MNKNIIKSWGIVSSLALLLASGLAAVTGVTSRATADETAVEKVENTADQANTDVKKHKKDAQKHARKATGQDNVAKDAADELSKAGDQAGTEARKAKKKID